MKNLQNCDVLFAFDSEFVLLDRVEEFQSKLVWHQNPGLALRLNRAIWPYLIKVLDQNFGAELVFTENASTSQATRIPTATPTERCQFVNFEQRNVVKELSTRIRKICSMVELFHKN